MLLKPDKDPRDPNSYRPVSLLSCIGKVLERLVNSHFNRTHIPNHQFGFRTKHNCTLQVQRLINNIAQVINLKQGGAVISMDVEAAFDRVPHRELVFKLSKTGQPDWLSALISSYLTDRSFYISVGNTQSGLMPIKAGTPQGAVWSPVLFNLYLYDSPGDPAALYQYADDTAFLVRGNARTINREGNRILAQFGGWCDTWKVKVNAAKSQAMVLGSTREVKTISLQYKNGFIPITKTIKYLGIHIDREINFNNHVLHQLSKAKRKEASLLQYVSHKNLSSTTKALLYTCLIQSSLLYGLPAWDMLGPANLLAIRRFERRWVRICTGSNIRGEDVEPLSPFPLFINSTNKIAVQNFLLLEAHANPLVRAMSAGTDAIPQDEHVPSVDRILLHLANHPIVHPV